MIDSFKILEAVLTVLFFMFVVPMMFFVYAKMAAFGVMAGIEVFNKMKREKDGKNET